MNFKAISGTSIRSFFSKLVSMSLLDLGKEQDREAASYITDMLTDFSRTENLYKINDSEGRKIHTVVEMLLETQNTERGYIMNERELRKYVGDFSLFMSGVFRDYVTNGSYLNYYVSEGAKSYRAVSRMDLESGSGDPLIFSKLSREFEFYSGALDYMKKVYISNFDSTESFAKYLHRIPRTRH